MAGAAAVHDVLLERDGELALVDAALDRLRDGAGGLVLLHGVAGIGKTRLLAECRRAAAERGLDVLSAQAAEIEQALGFGVARQLLERPLREARGRRRAALLDAAGAAAGLLRGEAVPAAGSDPVGGLVLSLYWLVVALAEQPLVVAVDDLHWADAPSLRLLAHTARRLEGVPLLLVGATRPPAADADPALLDLLALAGDGLVEPAPLSHAGVAGLVAERLGEVPDDGFAAACHDASGGNPFLVGELVAELRREGIAATARVHQVGPAAIAQSVGRRVAALGEPAVRVARAAAVLGPDAALAHVAEVAGLEAGEAAAAASALARAGILADSAPLAYAHPVLRVSVEDGLAAPERSLLHARAAGVLRAAGADAERVALHVLAADAGLVEDGRAVLVEAGEAALGRGVPAQAARCFARAADEPGPADPSLARRHALAALHAGDPAAPALAEAVLAPGDAELARALALALVARGDTPAAVAALERAAATEDREAKLGLEADLIGIAAVAAETIHAARERAQRWAGVRGETPAERLLLAGVARFLRTAAEAGEAASRALRGGELVAQATADAPVLYHATFMLIAADRFDEAEAVLDTAVADARARGSLFGFVMATTFRAAAAYRRGDLARAELEGRAALAAMHDGGWPMGLPNVVGWLVDALLDRGDLAGARAVLEEAGLADAVPDLALYQSIVGSRGRLLLAEGDHAGVLAAIEDAERRQQQFGFHGTSGTTYRWWGAPALLALGRPEEAVRRADEELEIARSWGSDRSVGMALRAKGLVTGGDEGIAFLEDAVARLERCGAQLELARALVDLGAAIRRARRRTEAREPLRRALDLATRIGAGALAERAREELRLAGAKPRRAALAGVDALTPSERRIAELAAGGLTNRQIAQQLFLTMKTVAYHLTSVYRKLDVASREELPAALSPPTARSPAGS